MDHIAKYESDLPIKHLKDDIGENLHTFGRGKILKRTHKRAIE